MTKGRIAAILALLLCVALSISLISVNISYSNALNQKDTQIADLTSTIDANNAQINQLQTQATTDNNTINSLTSQTTALQSQLNDYTAIMNMSRSNKLTTLIFHVSEKGPEYTWGHLPNVTYTYSQILNLNNGKYNILLQPEYEGNINWTATTAWLKQSFKNIPVMLPVFEGGSGSSPTTRLTTDQIAQIVATCNVQGLRIAEITSWYIDHNLPFPTDYVTTILNYAKTHGLTVEWSEWKVSTQVFQRIQNYTKGFEDIVTVTFQTNSAELQPIDGFLYVSRMFPNWGSSIQSWYWQTHGLGTELNMPTSLLVQHALAAKNTGTQILQFEPYWYFFDDGEPNQNFQNSDDYADLTNTIFSQLRFNPTKPQNPPKSRTHLGLV